MNKKLFVGAAALTTVVIGGYVYYRWVTSKLVADPELDDEETFTFDNSLYNLGGEKVVISSEDLEQEGKPRG